MKTVDPLLENPFGGMSAHTHRHRNTNPSQYMKAQRHTDTCRHKHTVHMQACTHTVIQNISTHTVTEDTSTHTVTEDTSTHTVTEDTSTHTHTHRRQPARESTSKARSL